MQIFLAALVVVRLISTSYCHKQITNDELNNNCKLLASALANVRGIHKCYIFVERHIKNRAIDQLIVELAKVIPTLPIKNINKKFKASRYRSKPDALKGIKSYSISREQKGLINRATANTVFIYVFADNTPNSLDRNLRYCQLLLSQPSNNPKILLVHITKIIRKPLYYQQIHRYVFQKYQMLDVDIVELLQPAKKRRAKRYLSKNRQSRHGFTIYQCNPLNCRHKKHRRPNKHIKWFQTRAINLHGHVIFINHVPYTALRGRMIKTILYDKNLINEKSRFGEILKRTMNFTYKYSSDLKSQDLGFPEQPVVDYDGIICLKANSPQTSYICTPIINDQHFTVNLINFVICFPLILLFAFLMKPFAKFSGFEPKTWSFLAVFKMLIGLDNPTGVTHSFMESTLFVLISITGIFFSNEFSEAAMSILNPITIERQFNNWQDLQASNLTVYIMYKPKTNTTHRLHMENVILESKVDYRVSDDINDIIALTTKMFYSSNIAQYQAEGPSFAPNLGSTISVDGRILAKRSGVSEYSWVVSYRVKDYSCYLERMSDVYWRFGEVGFHNYMRCYEELTAVNRALVETCLAAGGGSSLSEEDEVNELENNDIVIFCILNVGSVLAIIVLAIELLYFELKSCELMSKAIVESNNEEISNDNDKDSCQENLE